MQANKCTNAHKILITLSTMETCLLLKKEKIVNWKTTKTDTVYKDGYMDWLTFETNFINAFIL